MEKDVKFMVKILITTDNLFKEENRVWGFIIGMQNNVTQENL